ncbi:hypothetical protein AAFF_G00412810 [Aldrovandia affinis]|uniref:Uncharacterized protein n=1 Tax=Aldrovandia affinis TaxID=143900 RepID=A0AAD7SBF4_9TELE|nr:hypothetical protein AAFF_G00412810 [Aldrovandia affinis]
MFSQRSTVAAAERRGHGVTPIVEGDHLSHSPPHSCHNAPPTLPPSARPADKKGRGAIVRVPYASVTGAHSSAAAGWLGPPESHRSAASARTEDKHGTRNTTVAHTTTAVSSWLRERRENRGGANYAARCSDGEWRAGAAARRLQGRGGGAGG